MAINLLIAAIARRPDSEQRTLRQAVQVLEGIAADICSAEAR